MTSDSILRSIRQLPASEQITLLQQAWDALSASGQPLGLSTEQVAEYNRRLQRHTDYPEEAIPWEELERELDG